MLLLKFLRFVAGYVSFCAKGGFPERFINLCRLNGINLWELKSVNSVICACTDCNGYKKIRRAAKKSGMKVRIQRKHGLPFFLNRHSHRVGVLAGTFFCIAVICVLSTRVWTIDVIGNVRVPSEKITGVFEQLGVKKGVSENRVDITAVEIEALKHLEELSWVNINFDGCTAVIEVRERVINPENEEETPTEIVASRDGQIMILRPFSGTQEQKIGNAVVKGDLLISGIRENKDLTVSFCRAKGYVVARTERKINSEIKKEFTAEKTAVNKYSYIIEFLNFSIPLGKIPDGAYRDKTEVKINGITLPLALVRCVKTERENVSVSLSDEQARLVAGLRFFEQCTEDFRYLKAESKKITADAKPDGCALSGEFVCIENIGKEIPLEIEELAQ